MDAYEATKIVFSRIQALDPENAAKITGLLLIQGHGEKEMIRLAFGPESLLLSVVNSARKDLGFLPVSPPSAPPPPAAGLANSFNILRQNSASRLLIRPPPLSISSPASWPPPSPFSRATDETQAAGEELIDVLHLRDQLSFLNEPMGPKASSASPDDVLYSEECRSPIGADLFPYGIGWSTAANGVAQRRSCSVSDLCLGGDPTGAGWKPCLYFARGYCKNGTSCRFLHGLSDDTAEVVSGKIDAVVEETDLLLRSKSQRLMSSAATAFPYPPAVSLPHSPSSNGKCMNFLFQQQQSDCQRTAAAAASAAATALILGGEDTHNFMGRPRMERCDFAGLVNPASRQIYLTFPADSTFREEDVSNYFSIYGPVQDVRIPYQQKRMFGFVTFVYPETVKLILAKGNPHFVCDARVLVKPYKEKGKVPDKYRKLQGDRVDFSCCSSPSVLDSRHHYDLQQIGARMLYRGSNQDAVLRRKLEEQQELQQAIELQSRRFMGLQLLNLNINPPASNSAAVLSPTLLPVSTAIGSSTSLGGDNGLGPGSSAAPAAISRAEATSPKDDVDPQESPDHNLPDSPFASPTKSTVVAGESFSLFSETDTTAASTSASVLLSSTLLPATSTLENMASFKSCFFQMPRLSSGPGAVGL